METTPNPDQLTSATLAKIVIAGRLILDQRGVELMVPLGGSGDGKPNLLLAKVTLDTTSSELPGNKSHDVTIIKPLGTFACQANWVLRLTYDVTDYEAGRNVLVLKNELPTAKLSFVNGRPDKHLTELEAQAVADDLSRLADIES